MKKILKKILFVVLILFLFLIAYFSIGSVQPAENITWGVNFSQKQANLFGLDWQTLYLALLEDLEFKNIKIATHWDLIEREKGVYDFSDLDWQIETAGNYGAKVILVIGMKTPRWPECHMPGWTDYMIKEEQQASILDLVSQIVNRYKDSNSVIAWQVENEPFFPYGDCPWTDKAFLKKEIAQVKSLDNERLVSVSDSGEYSTWFTAAQLSDFVSSTLHRKVWYKEFKIYVDYFWFRPIYYARKAGLISFLFDKKVIIGELQAEPWCSHILPTNCSSEEQLRTMDLEKLKDNVKFARETGLDEIYFWGGEWWYWLREKQDSPQIWEEVKKIIN